jgi:hypothetical protein
MQALSLTIIEEDHADHPFVIAAEQFANRRI